MGVYRWDAPDGPANNDAFSTWLGRSMDLALAFEASDRWDNVDGAGWQLHPWSQWVQAKSGRNLVLSVPMLPGGWNLAGPDGQTGTADDLSLAKCAAGEYDVYWGNLANELAYYGLHWAYLRLGWEMDGGWYAWRAQQDQGNEANFAGCFRRIVMVMRATQPANQWKFVWNPTLNWWNESYLHAVWPGAEYVDFVGLDIYDQGWWQGTYPYPSPCDDACRLQRQQTNWSHQLWYLTTIRNFAVSHGKPMAFPEWGVAVRADGHGGGDNPYFIQQMYNFIHDPNNYVAWHNYWDVKASDLDAQLSYDTLFPKSAELFKQLFGATTAEPTPEPEPEPTPAPDTTPPAVNIVSPDASASIGRKQDVKLEASATDNVGVVSVKFYVNGSLVCERTASPYACNWRSPNGRVGSFTIEAVATDLTGNQATDTQVNRGSR